MDAQDCHQPDPGYFRSITGVGQILSSDVMKPEYSISSMIYSCPKCSFESFKPLGTTLGTIYKKYRGQRNNLIPKGTTRHTQKIGILQDNQLSHNKNSRDCAGKKEIQRDRCNGWPKMGPRSQPGCKGHFWVSWENLNWSGYLQGKNLLNRKGSSTVKRLQNSMYYCVYLIWAYVCKPMFKQRKEDTYQGVNSGWRGSDAFLFASLNFLIFYSTYILFL